MFRSAMLCLLATLGVSLAVPALAVNVTISGQFRSSVPTAPPVPFLEPCNTGDLPTEILGPITTNVSGTYQVRDSGNTFFSQNTVLSFYQGMPNLDDLEVNLLVSVDDIDSVMLQTGTDYYVLAQPFCDITANGVWGHLIRGPGTLQGPQVATTPAHWQGTWSESDGLTNVIPEFAGCPDTYYDVNGPITLETSGTWYVSTTSGYDGRPMAVSFHDGPFEPDDPYGNQVAVQPGGPFELEAGDYYIVIQGDCDVLLGDWYYVLWPPHPFEFNGAMSAAYRDPQTSGSGVLLDVDPALNFVFGAWFTWATPPAAGTISPQAVGNDSQRWLTMQGTYLPGDTAVDMTIFSSSGGVFDDPTAVETVAVGTATLDMEDCTTGTLSYTLESGETGDSVMGRLLPGNIEACEQNYEGPGVLYE